MCGLLHRGVKLEAQTFTCCSKHHAANVNGARCVLVPQSTADQWRLFAKCHAPMISPTHVFKHYCQIIHSTMNHAGPMPHPRGATTTGLDATPPSYMSNLGGGGYGVPCKGGGGRLEGVGGGGTAGGFGGGLDGVAGFGLVSFGLASTRPVVCGASQTVHA